VEVGRSVVATGLVVGSGGNMSARTPEGDECWVTGSGVWLARLDPAAFARMRILDGAATLPAAPSRDSPAGLVPTSLGPRSLGPSSLGPSSLGPSSLGPSSELGLHLAVYRARPDVTAVIHLHPQTVLLLDALDQAVRLVTTDHVYYLRRVGRIPFAPPGSAAVGELTAAAVRDGTDVVVLANHGCAVVADSVELAHKRALYLEEAARLTYAALALGRADALRLCPAEWVGRPGAV